MARLVLLIAIIGVALLLWYKIKLAKPAEKKKLVFWSILGILAAVLLLLAMTGHLNVITAAIAGLFALAPRAIQYARYIPFIKQTLNQNKTQNQQSQHQSGGSSSQQMDKAQAYQVLGLQPGCSREDILLAHKRMMQKMHPDRGGSDFLAAQINQAKDILLS